MLPFLPRLTSTSLKVVVVVFAMPVQVLVELVVLILAQTSTFSWKRSRKREGAGPTWKSFQWKVGEVVDLFVVVVMDSIEQNIEYHRIG